jgi:hypothetical protein
MATKTFPWIILTFAILISGCMPLVKHTGIHTVCSSPDTILGKVVVRDNAKGTLKALADLEIQTIGKKYPAKIAVMLKGPDSLRMEALPLIGPPDFMLSIKGDQLRVFIPQKGEFYMGKASQHLQRFLPMTIPARDAVSILLGMYPPLHEGDCFSPEIPVDDLQKINILSGEGKTRMSLWIKLPDQILVRIKSFGGQENDNYTVVFSDYGVSDQPVMPEKITVRSGGIAGLRQTITIRYSDLEFTEEQDDQSFELSIPPGAQLIELKSDTIKEN